jgi:hypothetical protein
MPAAKPHIVELKSSDPIVLLPLKQYEAMVALIEDLEDKAALYSRKSEENIPWEAVDKRFNKKFGTR